MRAVGGIGDTCVAPKREADELDDGRESGQCSEDDHDAHVRQKRSRKHKKRVKSSRSRKRKYSDSSTSNSSRPESDFFNPYSVSGDRMGLRSLLSLEEPLHEHEGHEEPPVDEQTVHNPPPLEPPHIDQQMPAIDNPIPIQPVPNITTTCNTVLRKSIYLIDKTGIESNNADLRYFLLDFGFNNELVGDVYSVLYETPQFDREEEDDEREEGGDTIEEDEQEEEEAMLNDLPIIVDSSARDPYANSYSPEPASALIEPYNPGFPAPANHNHLPPPPVSYAPIATLIDPSAIPDVSPKDPRLAPVNKHKFTAVNSFHKPAPATLVLPIDTASTNSDSDSLVAISSPPHLTGTHKIVPDNNNSVNINNNNNVQIGANWEVTVVNTVKTHLRLYLVHNDITKDEYKSILKRAVHKIISSGEKKLETDKISKFLHSYVIMTQKSRYADAM